MTLFCISICLIHFIFKDCAQFLFKLNNVYSQTITISFIEYTFSMKNNVTLNNLVQRQNRGSDVKVLFIKNRSRTVVTLLLFCFDFLWIGLYISQFLSAPSSHNLHDESSWKAHKNYQQLAHPLGEPPYKYIRRCVLLFIGRVNSIF